MKKFLTTGIILLFSYMFCCYNTYAADLTITNVYPTENVGVYEKNNSVNFILELADNKEENNGYYVILDIDGKIIKNGDFKISAGVSEYQLGLGYFEPGWYRIFVYNDDKQTLAYDEYAAFSVVEPYSQRYTGKTPFAADHAGIEWQNDSGVMNAYAKALSLAGVGFVRERAYMSSDPATYETNRVQAKAYNDNGISSLNVWAKPSTFTNETNLFDVYNMQKGFATEFSDSVKAWEIINEPDMISDLTPDVYQGFLKAAALGVYDSNSDAVKSFGGLCVLTPFFREAIMANGVMEYSDIFNVHTHTNGTSEVYTPLSAGLLDTGKLLSTVYTGSPKPMWVTESGIRLDIDENSDLTEDCYKRQAKYVITSTVESLTKGTDKHFYFLTRHFIEDGKQFGIFHKSNMPYPAYSAFSSLTYHLGKATYKGDLKLLPESVRGYVFDTGEGDAIVLWNTEEKTDYVQFRSENDVLVVSLLGDTVKRRYNSYHNKVNLPVTSSPVIVKLNAKVDLGDYYPRSFPTVTDTASRIRPNGIVIMPQWENAEISGNMYCVTAGTTYKVKLNIYNFNSESATGNIKAEITDGFKADTDTIAQYKVEGNSKTVVEWSFTVKEDAMWGEERICFTTDNNARAVSYFSVNNDAAISDESKQMIDGVGRKDNWTLDNTGSCTKYNDYFGNSAKFTVTFNNVASRYSFPSFAVEKGSFADTDGMALDLSVAQKTGREKFMVRVWTEGGGSFRTSGEEFSGGSYVFSWDEFGRYGGSENTLKPENIVKFAIGFETYIDGTTEYTIKNLCVYSIDSYEEQEQIVIEGIKDGAVYKNGENIKASVCLQEEKEGLAAYLNYKPCEIEVKDNSANIEFTDLDVGAYNLIVTYPDRFGKQIYADVSFYVGNKTWDVGTFF